MSLIEKEVVCKTCGKKFSVDFDSEKVFCMSCGAEIAAETEKTVPPPPPPEPEAVAPEEKKEAPSKCPKCGTSSSDKNTVHACAVCKSHFCDSCPGLHVPPEQPQLIAKLIYKYRIRPSTVWNSDAHTLTEALPSPLCDSCYDKEFENGISRLKNKIRNWRVDQLREMDMKDVEENLPKRKEDEKKIVVERAQELLKMMGKG